MRDLSHHPDSLIESEAAPASIPAVGEMNWAKLVQRIQRGDDSGMEELYRVFAKGVRFLLRRSLGWREVDDKVHDTFLIVVQAIRRGDLRQPERLMGFVRTVVRRQAAHSVNQIVQRRRDSVDFDIGERIADYHRNAEDAIAFRQKVELMKTVLGELPARHREILIRFYLDEQTEQQICKDLNLSGTQFRLLKSRAKDRFGALGKKKLGQRKLVSFGVRSSSGYWH
jgi:RNA polymerase sigma factor (sigma-70 family)